MSERKLESLVVRKIEIEGVENSFEAREIIEEFCNTVLTKEQFIDSGNSANVYKDPRGTNACYKMLKAGQLANRSISEEATFLSAVYDPTQVVKTPYPIGYARAGLVVDGKKQLYQILGMEYFENSIPLKEILPDDKNPRPELLPIGFSAETFCSHLESLLHSLNTEKRIAHNDFFPRNILIDKETLLPIVIDFGESRFLDPDEKFDKDLKHLYSIRNSLLELIH
jgi:serine/threonine protein kinase